MSHARIGIVGLALAVALVGITGTAQAVVTDDLLVELVAEDNPTVDHDANKWATTGNSSLSGKYTTAGGVNRPARTVTSPRAPRAP